MIRVAVLYGGRSGEHDVSLCSAASVVSAINKSKYSVLAVGVDRDGKWYVQDEPVIDSHPDFGRVMRLEKKGEWYVNHFEMGNKLHLHDIDSGKKIEADVVFPVMHGTYCEDGSLQGLLELAMVPYVGADVLGSAVGMDKDVAKRILRDSGIPVVPWLVITRREWESSQGTVVKQVEGSIGFPAFIKPAAAGSSVGVKKAKSGHELMDAIHFAFKYDTKILVEKSIDAREIECAIIGNEDPVGSILGEVVPRHEFYSYEAKYLDKAGADLIIPAGVDQAVAEKIRSMAVAGYRALTCAGMARVDFFLDRVDGTVFLNEINTLPGFTNISMYPKLWGESGIPYDKLIDRLIELAFDRHRQKLQIRTGI